MTTTKMTFATPDGPLEVTFLESAGSASGAAGAAKCPNPKCGAIHVMFSPREAVLISPGGDRAEVLMSGGTRLFAGVELDAPEALELAAQLVRAAGREAADAFFIGRRMHAKEGLH